MKEYLGNMLHAVTRVLKNCGKSGSRNRVSVWQVNTASVATMLNLQVTLEFSNYLILISCLRGLEFFSITLEALKKCKNLPISRSVCPHVTTSKFWFVQTVMTPII